MARCKERMAKRSNISLIIICTVLSLITNFPSGYTNATVNTAVTSVERYIRESYRLRGQNITEDSVALVKGAVINCWFIVMVFGACCTPYITDTLGRKIGYIIAVVVAIVAAIIQYVSVLFHLPEVFILGRSMTAFCSPLADACLLLYLQEVSPLSIRGMASFLCEIGYGAMVVLGMVLGMSAVLGGALDILMLVPLVPLTLSLIFLMFIPETPKFLMIMRGDREKALRSLEFFRGDEKENERLLDDYEREKLQEANQERSSLKIFLVLFAVFSMLAYTAPWMKYACIASAVCYCVSFGMVLGPVSWFVAPELVPLKHKSLVFSLCFGANNVFIAITDFLAIVLFQKYGAIVFIGLFTIPSLICLIYVYMYLPETKGKEIDGIIEEMLKKAKKAPLKIEESSQRVRGGYQVFATESSTTAVP
ncbi:transporter, major facilitator family protein [Ancylostoma ceylanicum]|uniref:Transporter, major facilitator family protein n=1 Tax=Ancylostoma ceylanicum TaxID=53326 RepID=A0A0D6LT01_9BILA|nr:transporter, major facilitator family protein [Ancylostoma ceylanicum]